MARGVCNNCYEIYLYERNPEYRMGGIKRGTAHFVKNKDRLYLIRVKSKYKLSAMDHAALFELQQGRCAICFTHQDKLGTRLCVDHDHNTGLVRGLLCAGCNQMLGYHEKRKTGAWSNYLANPPMRELKYLRETPLDQQVHPL